MERQGHARAGAAVSAAAAAAVIAVALAAITAGRGGARPATLVGGGWGAVTAPHPFYAPFVEFNADEGSAGPAHNHAALDYMAGKAGASQEWLQYSLHHDGTLQQARAPQGAARGAAAAAAAAAVQAGRAKTTDERARGRASSGSDKRGVLESSGNFQNDDGSLFRSLARARASSGPEKKRQAKSSGNFQHDDGSLFGDGTFKSAEATPSRIARRSKLDSVLPPGSTQAASQQGNDEDDYCVDENGKKVECGDDYYCVDEQGNEVPCEDEEEEKEPEEEREPSDFLQSMVKAVASEAMPPGASQVLKESVKSVEAAKEELKAAAKLKAMAAADDKRVESLQGREAELENYQSEKEKFADAAQEIARKADEEYQAEEDQVLEMDGVARTEGTETTTGVATKGSAGKADGEGAEALRQRLQRHLPLLRVVDKLAQRVGTLKSRGRHPRSEHQLPRRPQVP